MVAITDAAALLPPGKRAGALRVCLAIRAATQARQACDRRDRRYVLELFAEYKPAPIGCALHDLDYYSSTRDALTLFDDDSSYFLPRAFMYFDDVVGDETWLCNEFTGELLAIDEFNQKHPVKENLQESDRSEAISEFVVSTPSDCAQEKALHMTV